MKEQVFFADPAFDCVLGVVMSLAAEVYILRDRTQALEQLLDQRGVVNAQAIEDFSDEAATREANRASFINSILEPLIANRFAASRVDDFYVQTVR